MKNFFGLLFGGLGAIFFGVAIGWMAHKVSKDGFIKAITFGTNKDESAASISPEIYPAKSNGKISATSYIVRDLTTNTVVAGHAQDLPLPIASITKLVTAVVAHRLIPDADRVVISQEAIDTYGDTANLRVGEVYSANDLLYPLLMVSSNDAAEALAMKYGRARFIQAMNDFVQSIGAHQTIFMDPSGLSQYNQSTASEMSMILDWVRLHDTTVLGITELKAKTIHAHTWVNPAHFLSLSYYIGGKNGYTDEADNTTASLFRLGANNDVYAIVVLGSANRDVDVTELLKKIK